MNDIPRYVTAVAEWLACFTYLMMMRKRYGWKRFAVHSAAALVIQICFLEMTAHYVDYRWILCMMTAYGLMWTYIAFHTELPKRFILYISNKAFLLAELSAALFWQLHSYFAVFNVSSVFFSVILFIAVFGLMYMLAYILEKDKIRDDYIYELKTTDLIYSSAITLLIMITSNLGYVVSFVPIASNDIWDIFRTRTLTDLLGVIALYAYQVSRVAVHEGHMKESMHTMLENQYKQYRSYKSSLDYFQEKYHDLKFQIAELRSEKNQDLRRRRLDNIERNLDNANAMPMTGNSVLDAILGMKVIDANNIHARMTYVVDGKLLGFLNANDLITIFSSALDNSIKAVAKIPDENNRLIHITVSKEKQFVLVKIINYLDDKTISENDLSADTKLRKQRFERGFGLKSIANTVEKYGGTMSYAIRDRFFELTILFTVNI